MCDICLGFFFFFFHFGILILWCILVGHDCSCVLKIVFVGLEICGGEE